MPIRTVPLLAALMLASAPAAAVGPAPEPASAAEAEAAPVYVQFRDLFTRDGKPSARAIALDGQRVRMTGFLAIPPSKDSPFLVFVGAPTVHCPYCTTVREESHDPYALIYPADPETAPRARKRRIEVVATLDAQAEHEHFYGLHNDVRLLAAEVRYDEPYRHPFRSSGPKPLPEDVIERAAPLRRATIDRRSAMEDYEAEE